MTRNYRNTLLGFAALLFALPAFSGTLADSPLYLEAAVPPNVLFSLSVEYPTANTAAYQGTNNYSATTDYLGLFDAAKCYSYTSGRFEPVSLAGSDHDCTGNWSGSFLNWATMTGLDEFRSAMTGGNRSTDTSTETVLERTYQSGQGGTSNFPNKTYAGSDATPYPATTTLTIQNQGMGHNLRVTLGGSGTALCTNPQLVGSNFSCSMSMQDSGETGACTTWAGDGTTATPYRCATFGAFTDIGTPTGSTPVAGSVSTVAPSGSTTTVSCTSPSGTTSANFSCTLSGSATCTTWTGNGTSGTPFSCSTFSNFSVSSQGASATYTESPQVTQPADPVSSCSISSSGTHPITCTLNSGRTAVCANPTGRGANNNTGAYQCSSSNAWTISGTPAATYVSNTIGARVCGYNCSSGTKKYYRPPTSVTYSIPVSSTLYYISSYTGSALSNNNYYTQYSLTFGGFTDYYVGVKVCDPNIGLEGNCVRYGTSIYKPVGAVQKNAEKMRFGLFSYYKANDIDNAVMRSKMKYTAPLKWSSAGGYVSNTNAEWSASTGILVANPDSAEATASYGGAVSKSGVINYINQFGKAASGYKTYDNVGKLYYEGLRYLRGLTPTSAFYEDATLASGDGFPIISSWDATANDPVQYWCQKNFIFAMGDTHTHCDKRLPGGLSSSYGSSQCAAKTYQVADVGSLAGDSSVDVGAWTNALGNLESPMRTNLGTTFGFAGTASYYMAGLAYNAAKDGFRTMSVNGVAHAVKAQTYVIDVQEYGDRGIGSQYWLAAKYGGPSKFDSTGRPDEANDGTTFGNTDWAVSDASFSGGIRPKTLLPAGNPQAMYDAVNSAFSAISAQTGEGADVGLSTGDLRSGNGTNLYSATYDSSGWRGDVLSYRMSSDLSINIGTPVWRASTTLNPTTLNPATGTPPWTTRRIITFNDGLAADGTSDGSVTGRQGAEFSNIDTDFSERQRALLDLDPGSLTYDGRGDVRVDYLRGDNSNEGTNGYGWRVRSATSANPTSMGDIINSSPLYVRFPDRASIPVADYASFSTYAASVRDRTPVVYVGSNDGMLHVLDASDDSDDGVTAPGPTGTSGRELLAYVPAAVYPKLNQLTWPNYSHKYFVDGSPVAADVQLSSGWKTMITGGLNNGGQGIYALNGTDPGAFAAGTAKSLVLWEFTDRDDADLGATFSRPLVKKMNNGKWAVIIGNGYNNTLSDGSASTTGHAYLYILYADGPGFATDGRGEAWAQGTNYQKIELIAPNASGTPLLPANGLSTVYGVDKNDDGKVDYLYAGDRYGNLWKIDVSSSSPASWQSAFMSGSTPLPLFTATTADTIPLNQQVTTSPMVVPHPKGGFLVMMGTGSFVDQSDNTAPFSTNTFYGIWDKDDGTRVTSRSSLQKQKTLANVTDGSITYSIESNCKPQYNATATVRDAATTLCPSSLLPATDPVPQQLGWVRDLQNNPAVANSGERYMSSILPIVNSGLLSFVTLTPSGDVCGGTSYDFLYNLDYLSGGAFPRPLYYNSTGSPIYFTVNIGGVDVQVAPSGKKLRTAIGQNPKAVFFETEHGTTTPSTSSGCTNYVKGRPCVKDLYMCAIVTAGTGCDSLIKLEHGRVSWRQIVQ